jgi:hypothetical protein
MVMDIDSNGDRDGHDGGGDPNILELLFGDLSLFP